MNSSTVILFPGGATQHTSEVIAARWYRPDESLAVVITAETPFHPVDHTWPDQPGDSGTIFVAGQVFPVVDTIVAACAHGSTSLCFGSKLPKRNTPGWYWLVAHVVVLSNAEPAGILDQRANLSVDAERRLALSAGHTASHLFSFAFNLHTRLFWRNDAPKIDSLRNPDVDQLAMQSSQILPGESLDSYRFGKTMTKSGFNRAAFLETLDETRERINTTFREWIDRGGRISIECSSQTLDARRQWVCDLPPGTARMFCGGTHLGDLNQLQKATVQFERLPGEVEIKARTITILR